MKTPTELTSVTVGAFVYGELSARSTKLRTPWMSCSKDAIDKLKSTFHATLQLASHHWDCIESHGQTHH